MKIPHYLLPGFWGLRGKTLERAKAEYYLSGRELDVALAKLDFQEPKLTEELLKIDLKYGLISEEKYEAHLIENMDDSVEKQIAAVESLLKFKHISDQEYRKRISTINGEPFFEFDVNLVQGELQIEAEYNKYFVNYIKKFGYDDDVEQDAIDAYINDLGRKISTANPDEELLDLNESLDESMIKVSRDGEFTSYE